MSFAYLDRPMSDPIDPQLTILVPAMDEEETISTFVAWCHEGIREAGLVGEILIVDSSTDSTPDLALAGGARVLRTSPKGLGAAYIEGIPHVRGAFVIMGDADCTYDFRQLSQFVRAWESGSKFVMGSRFKGSIEPGAMPKLHQYFGTPITTWLLNKIFGGSFSDIHCGMRGVDADTLREMRISSTSWEYASEMVIKAIQLELPISEVPINFYADRGSRQSHMKRRGHLEPFRAGWSNVKSMLTYGAPYFLRRPGQIFLLLGLIGFMFLFLGPISLGPIELSGSTRLVAVFVAILGLQMVLLAHIAEAVMDYTGLRRDRLKHRFNLDRMFLICGGLGVGGVALILPLLLNYASNGMRLVNIPEWQESFVLAGLLLIICGFCLFTASLVIQSIAVRFSELAPMLDNM